MQALAALLLALPLSAAGYQGPFAGRPDVVACGAASEPVALPAAACASLARAAEILKALAAHARVPAPALEVLVWSDRLPNARYLMNSVAVSYALLRDFGQDEDVLTVVLSHELGHAEQEDAGVWPDYQKFGLTSAQVEAHADARGVRLAAAAGVSPVRWRSAMARLLASAPGENGNATHPLFEKRLANAADYGRRPGGADGLRPADFDRLGRLRP